MCRPETWKLVKLQSAPAYDSVRTWETKNVDYEW